MIEVLIIDYILRRIENNLSLSDPGVFGKMKSVQKGLKKLAAGQG